MTLTSNQSLETSPDSSADIVLDPQHVQLRTTVIISTTAATATTGSRRRPDVTNNVRHLTVSNPTIDAVTPERQAEIARLLAAKLELSRTMWGAVRHKDHAHDEFHLFYLNITFKGDTLNDSHSFQHLEVIAREIESQLGLQQVPSSHEMMRRSLTQGEVKQMERTDEAPVRLQMQIAVDRIINRQINNQTNGDISRETNGEITLTELIERLAAQERINVTAHYDERDTLLGISYELDCLCFRW